MVETARPRIEALLRTMVAEGAADLHLRVDQPPWIRVDGRLHQIPEYPALTAFELKYLVYSLLTSGQITDFESTQELDFAFTIPELSRFRGNLFMEQGRLSAAIRMIPFDIIPLQNLGIPMGFMRELCNKSKGLVLITGATGSGKTTTLAAMVDYINQTRDVHVVSIEDPIEYLHKSNKSIVSQREIGRDTADFDAALKHILRQDPDVILIGEMRDHETIRSALNIAETGHLVLATLHTSDAVQTINRVVDVFPSEQQNQARVQLSTELLSIICQQLIPKPDGGRVLASEILVATHATRALIRENRLHQLYSTMQTGASLGMHTMNRSLYDLVVHEGLPEIIAMGHSSDVQELQGMLKGADARSKKSGHR